MNSYQGFSLKLFFIFLVVALSSFGNNSLERALPNTKLLLETKTLQEISLKHALTQALVHHDKLLISRTQVERRKVESLIRMGSLLPKARLGASYTRNIPEIESSPFRAGQPSSINRHVANLLRKDNQMAAAEEVEAEGLLMTRRSPDSKILIAPKNVFDGRLTVEVPLFNGPDIARFLASRENIKLQEARFREDEANTIYTTAKAFYTAVHLKNILALREQAEISANERFLKAKAQRKRDLIIERDFLLAEANALQKQAERQSSHLDYRSSIAELGLLMGLGEEFELELVENEDILFNDLPDDVDQLIQIALANRPDLKAEQQALKIAHNERLGNFFQFLPTLTLQGNAKYTSNDKGMTGRHLTYDISANANLPIFDGGISMFQLWESSLKRKESEIKIRQLQKDIAARMRGRKEKLLRLKLSEQAWELKAKAEKEAEKVANSHFNRGLIDQQELLEVTDRKLNTDIAYKKSQSDLKEEQLGLISDLGKLSRDLINGFGGGH